MARIVLERAGWNVTYLGANVPYEEIAGIQELERSRLLCVSFSPPLGPSDARRCLKVLNALRRRGVDRGRIGLMGTSATLRLGLYQQALQAQGYECVVPSAEEIERYCTPCIALVKTNRIEQSLAPALECIRLLRDRGIDALVLGCTELPLALPEPQRLALGLPVVDSVDALAIDALSWYRSESA